MTSVFIDAMARGPKKEETKIYGEVKKLEKDDESTRYQIDDEILVVDKMYSCVPTIEGNEHQIINNLKRKDCIEKVDLLTRRKKIL